VILGVSTEKKHLTCQDIKHLFMDIHWYKLIWIKWNFLENLTKLIFFYKFFYYYYYFTV